MKCDACGKSFKRGNYVDGTPNGMGFVMENRTITLCRGCIIKLGMMSKEQKNEFFKKLLGEKENGDSEV